MIHTFNKRDRLISIVYKQQTRYLKKTHKFVIELLKTFSEFHKFHKKNGTTLWADSIAKYMKSLKIAFDIIPDREYLPNVH